jgi:hypothetical protein
MELPTQALDRVLQALSPALAAELDRLVNETRKALEADFQNRLQAAVRDAETAAQSQTKDELERAVQEAQNSVRQQVTEQLQAQFASALEEKSSQLQQLQSESASERARLQEELQRWRIFAEAQRQLAEAASQPEILSRFLRLAEPFAPALAIYISRPDGLALWKSRGQHAFPEIISEQTRDPEIYFKQIVVRGRTVGAVAAAGPGSKPDALDFMLAAIERAIEVFGLKLRAPSPKPPQLIRGPAAAVAASDAGSRSASPPPAQAADEAAAQQIEMRKLARLLVSEIKLYNEPALKEGRTTSNIYERLRKEIDKGRESYNQRLQGAALTSHDYYHDELVRILAGNEEALLGEAYPGPSGAAGAARGAGGANS